MKTNLNRLQLDQNKAARLVLRFSYYTSVDEMHNRLSWFPVEFKLYCLLLFIKKAIL